MKLLPSIVAFSLTALQLACAQAGDSARQAGSQQCDPKAADCTPAPKKNAVQPLEPAVPAVPNSPLRIDCQHLPTQVERDTCVNRKQSTG